METRDQNTIVMYRPLPKAGRVKFYIPYLLTAKREAFKNLNTSFYHSNQKLWSLVNTQKNIDLAKGVLGDKIRIETLEAVASQPPEDGSKRV